MFAANCYLRLLWVVLFFALAGNVGAQPVPGYVFSGPLLPQVLQMPGNSWLKVNTNLYSDVWTPPELEPLDNGRPLTPARIIIPWSGFAWDSNRGDLILYGGGHANYPGNDVYRWRSSTLQWERASLPSEIYFDPVAGFQAIDGVNAAPVAAHTYDNNTFLPIVDRFLTWGGAAYNNGNYYRRVSETNPTTFRATGPYLFDPNRADGNKVGGTTGSHVMRVAPHPEVVGGQMWENRDIPLHLAGQSIPEDSLDGCSNAVVEGGKDVVYVGATHLSATDLGVWRYQLTDINNPALDQSSQVGAYVVGPVGITTCGFDPGRKLFVRTGNNAMPFIFWDLTMAGPANSDRQVQVNSTFVGLQSWLNANSLQIENCALKFDPVRQTFPLWCGAATIWELLAPAGGNTTSGWTITQLPTPPSPAPPGDTGGTGVLGKWRYAPFYNVFVGLENAFEGHIWIYKPAGWVQPNPAGNALPTVTLTSPANGITISPGTRLNLTANAADADGTVSRVEFWANGVKLGQATSAPYAAPWTPMFVGNYKIVAIAVDNVGGMTVSGVVNLTVDAPLTTVILQRGVAGYSGVSDTFLNAAASTVVYGASTPLYLDGANYIPLLRFAVFQYEGGPVPNNAVIQSAKLELYKGFYDYTLQLNALLKPWIEGEATWLNSQAGALWSVAGAAGAGNDYVTSPDIVTTGSFNPGWLPFDVTPRVQLWSNQTIANYGWRLSENVPVLVNTIVFNSSEYANDPTLKPKLTVVFAPPVSSGPVTTSTTLASSANPSTFGTSVTFTTSVTGTAPTGTVNFKDGATSITGCSAVALTGSGNTRTAACATASLGVATHSIVASYGGDAGNLASNSATLSQVVTSGGGGGSTNVALAANGGVASASSTYPFGTYSVASIIDGDRTGANWGGGGGWQDGTGWVFPDYVQVSFGGQKTIDHVVVYSLQDNFPRVDPSDAMTFTQYGLTDFQVLGWNGASWVTLASVAGNNLVKRTVSVAATTTDRIRINVTGGVAGYSRIIEVEAWTTGGGGAVPTTTTVVSSLNPSTSGASVTFTASVTGTAPTGTVNFKDGATSITGCSAVALTGSSNTRASACTTSSLSVGTHSMSAAYGGDAGNLASTSTTLSQVVTSGGSSINVALAANGGVASASSTYSIVYGAYPASSVINGERAGANWGAGDGWMDGTGWVFPDYVQVNFSGQKTIDRVVVYSLQDNFPRVDPSDTMTFTKYGVTDFQVQGWNGASWVTLGSVAGNNLVKRTVNFTATTTDRLRVNVTSAVGGYSRITEIEAWGN